MFASVGMMETIIGVILVFTITINFIMLEPVWQMKGGTCTTIVMELTVSKAASRRADISQLIQVFLGLHNLKSEVGVDLLKNSTVSLSLVQKMVFIYDQILDHRRYLAIS
jgi:hypothetical protein